MSEPHRAHQDGKLITLEGDSGVISLQLQLLPKSPGILILSPVSKYLVEASEQRFDARLFVQEVYKVYEHRQNEARSFLQGEVTNHLKRLVFMNGGSTSARTTCISRICEELTGGDTFAAERIFDEIVKDGVAGLTRPGIKFKASDTTMSEQTDVQQINFGIGNASVRAMKAAEILDQETAALQPSVEEEDLLAIFHEGAIEGMMNNATGFYESETNKSSETLGSGYGHKGQVVTTTFTSPTRYSIAQDNSANRKMLRDQCEPRLRQMTSSPQTMQSVFSADSSEADLNSPTELVEPVIIGEAQVVDIGAPTKGHVLTRTKHVDGIKWLRSQSNIIELARSSMDPLKPTASHRDLPRRCVFTDSSIRLNYKTPCDPVMSSTPTVLQTTINQCPTRKNAQASLPSLHDLQRCVYVDTRTQMDDISPVLSEAFISAPVVPVFRPYEDLVVHFIRHTNDNENFETKVKSWHSGYYHTLSEASTDSTLLSSRNGDLAPGSTSKLDGVELDQRETSFILDEEPSSEAIGSGRSGRHLEPYAYHQTVQLYGSSSPATSSPTRMRARKFLKYNAEDPNSAIDLQNLLRHLLKTRFTCETEPGRDCDILYFRAESLWKPLFRCENSSLGRIESSNVDQIIALGFEDGVNGDFVSQISGRIERLGTKMSGINQSGKIDIRYLISNVTQRLTTVCPEPALDTPNNASMLAAALIPQLDSYLTYNSNTRVLILRFPAIHLPTIFALRQIIGWDLMRIAGIVDSLVSEPSSCTLSRTASSKHVLSNEAVAFRRARHTRSLLKSEHWDISMMLAHSSSPSLGSPATFTSQTSTKPSFSKADFVLPSTATDTEISTFISSIHSCLVRRSSSYNREVDPEPTTTTIEKFIKRDALPYTPATCVKSQCYCSPKTYDRNPPVSSPSRDFKSTNPISNDDTRNRSLPPSERTYANSVQTTASERERKWENFYIDEEESEDDEWDRKLLGRYVDEDVKRWLGEGGRGYGAFDDGCGRCEKMYSSRAEVGVWNEVDMDRAARSKRKAMRWLGLI